MRFILIASLFASFLLAKMPDQSTANSTLLVYHQAIQTGDIATLKNVMTEESFDTDMQVYALSIALQDKSFHKLLKAYPHDNAAKLTVQKAVSKKLKERKSRTISSLTSYDIGDDRVMIRFLEDGKKKQLYLSKEAKEWKINYKAGRKTRP